MIDNRTLDELAEKLSAVLPDGIKVMKRDIESNFRAVLESTFSKMNLVSREEFEVQAALLKRTQDKLKKLEHAVEELSTK